MFEEVSLNLISHYQLQFTKQCLPEFQGLETEEHELFILTSVSLGSMNQNQRLDAMAKLKQFHCRVLISTDLVSQYFTAYVSVANKAVCDGQICLDVEQNIHVLIKCVT